jgi:carbonic anhydrase
METFTDEVMRALLKQSLDTAELGTHGWKDLGKGRVPRKATSLIG